MIVEISALRGQIEQEIEAEGGLDNYFNNFSLKIPIAGFPQIPGEPRIRTSQYRYLFARAGLLDVLNQQIVKETHGFRKGFSERFLRQTLRQFFLTVDNAVEELGLEEVINQAGQLGNHSTSGLNIPALNRKVVPLYIRLRKIGYSHRDLTG